MVAENAQQIDISSIGTHPVKSREDLGTTLGRQFYDYWLKLSKSQLLSEFDLLEIPQIVPLVAILDVVADGADAIFRMNGQAIVDISANDLTGRGLKTSVKEAPLTRKFCDAVLEKGEPQFTRDSFKILRNTETYQFIECVAVPLLDKGGNIYRIVLMYQLAP